MIDDTIRKGGSTMMKSVAMVEVEVMTYIVSFFSIIVLTMWVSVKLVSVLVELTPANHDSLALLFTILFVTSIFLAFEGTERISRLWALS